MRMRGVAHGRCLRKARGGHYGLILRSDRRGKAEGVDMDPFYRGVNVSKRLSYTKHLTVTSLKLSYFLSS